MEESLNIGENEREEEQMLSVTKLDVDPENEKETKIEDIVGKIPAQTSSQRKKEISLQ